VSGEKVSHLEIIVDLLDQSNRTAAFAKRWGVSFAAVFIALGTQEVGFKVAYLAVFPLVFLWLLDAQTTRREYLLNTLYERVRVLDDAAVDFSINVEALPEARRSTFGFFLSPDPALFYVAMILGIAAVDMLIK
jgi:hypothetical protein